MKDKLIRDIEIRLAMQGHSPDEVNRIIHSIIGCLDNYEVTEKVTDLTVRADDINIKIMKRYAACLSISGKSERTIKAYIREIQRFTETVCKPLTEVTANDIRYYLGESKLRGSKNSYIKSQRAYISALCKWMLSEEIIEKNPCEKVSDVKCEKEVRLPFSPVEIDKMRKSANTTRDRAIIETMLSSGIRLAELTSLDIADCDLKNRSITVRRGKGGKGRIAYISEIAAEYLAQYLSERKDDEVCLFIGSQGRLKERAVGTMITRTAKRANVKNAHPHRFRRTFATTMHKRGMPLEEIRKLMGHTNVETTLRYIHTDESQVKACYEKYAA